MHRADRLERQAVMLHPGEEAGGGAAIGPPGIRVADLGSEERGGPFDGARPGPLDDHRQPDTRAWQQRRRQRGNVGHGVRPPACPNQSVITSFITDWRGGGGGRSMTEITIVATPVPSAASTRLPALIVRAGPRAAERTIAFFTAEIRNLDTRRAYGRAAAGFFAWMERHGLALEEIGPVHVAAWVESLALELETASVKQHLAGVRMLFDYLVTGGVLRANPVSSVRGPRLSVRTMASSTVMRPSQANSSRRNTAGCSG